VTLGVRKEPWINKRYSTTLNAVAFPIIGQPHSSPSSSSLSSSSSPTLSSPRGLSPPHRKGSDEKSPRSPRTTAVTPTSRNFHLVATSSAFPYQRVIDSLARIPDAHSPIAKLECITQASNGILSCVDEFFTDKTQNILMGAEDKFPVLIYALIRANIPDLWSQCYLMQDFVSEHIGDEESKYRASELIDAIKYIQSLDWNLRDKQGILIPVKMILSSVNWAAKAVERMKFNEKVDAETEKFEILLNLSNVFRSISQRRSNIYSPYKIPHKTAKFICKYEHFYISCLEAKDVGLKLRKEGKNEGGIGTPVYYVDFDLYHPVYVYQKLSETCVILEAE